MRGSGFAVRDWLRLLDVSSINWSRTQVLLGETMREVGILFLVFAPLDAIIEGDPALQRFAGWAVAGGVTLILVGILLEVKE